MYITGLSAVDETTDYLRAAVSDVVHSDLANFVHDVEDVAVRYNDLYEINVADAIGNMGSTLPLLCRLLFNIDNFAVAVYTATEATGELLLCEKNVIDNMLKYDKMVRNATLPNATIFWLRMDNVTYAEEEQIWVIPGYDPRARPWYTEMKAANKLVWTAPYTCAGGERVCLTIAAPLRASLSNKTLVGSVAVDLTINTIHSFLRDVKYGKTGRALIVDHGTLNVLGNSFNENLTNVVPPEVMGDDPSHVLKQLDDVNDANMRFVNDHFGGGNMSLMEHPAGSFKVADLWVTLDDVTSLDGTLLWRVVVAINEDDFLGNLKANRDATILGVVIALVVFIGIETFILSVVLQDLVTLTEAMDGDHFLVTEAPKPALATDDEEAALIKNVDGGLGASTGSQSAIAEIAVMQAAFSRMSNTVSSFARYVPKEVVADLLSQGHEATLGMQNHMCTILFADIVGFTSICEKLSEVAVAELLGHYFDLQSNIIISLGGTIDKYIGDCVMAMWGAPVGIDNQNLRACAAVLELRDAVQREVNAAYYERYGVTIAVRIGAHHASVLAGNMGGRARLSYTLLGDGVNLASRLEALNKQFGTQCLISSSVIEKHQDIFCTRLLGDVAVVGKTESIRVYELMGLRQTWRTHTSFSRGRSTVAGAGSVNLSNVATVAAKDEAAVSFGGEGSPAQNPVELLDVDEEMQESRGHFPMQQPDAPFEMMSTNAGTSFGRARRQVEFFRHQREDRILDLEAIIDTFAKDTRVCTEPEELFALTYSSAVDSFLAAEFKVALMSADSALACAKEAWPTVPEGVTESMNQLRADCEELLSAPPGAEWSGVLRLDRK
jgi:class 3 adenylate cyclase